MNMVGHTAHPVTFAASVAGDRGQIRVEFGPRVDVEQGEAILSWFGVTKAI
jgi:hypothetical protein